MNSHKGLLVGFILFVLLGEALAQTKEETEKWIVNKLNSLKSTKTYLHTQQGFNIDGTGYDFQKYKYIPDTIELKNGFLTIKYIVINENRNGEIEIDTITAEAEIKYISNIDIFDANKLKTNIENDNVNRFSGDSWLVVRFSMKAVKIKRYTKTVFKGKITRSDQYEDSYDTATILIDPKAEEDIGNRILNAFNHLKTFYPKPKETF